ncbi:MAG: helix-turn-helix domain-containing protein [Clostridia bacterium]|nr:helix-turn-helix domain-containing protein [Clostridia bacterium]
MNEKIISILSEISPEEERLLAGAELDRGLYSTEEEFIVSGARLFSGRREISMRKHPRFTVFPEHRHSFVEVMLVLSGQITHRINGEVITLGEGDLLFLNKHAHHSIERAESSDIGVNIIMSDEFLDELSAEASGTVFSPFIRENARGRGEAMYLVFKTGGERLYENIFENLLLELLGERCNREIMSRTVSLLLLSLSLDGERVLAHASHAPDADERRRIEILTYIKSHFRDASLTGLSEVTYLCVPYLSRTVKRLFGKSFSELLLEERMARAAALLRDSDIPVGDVISAVGYENDSYFHRRFKDIAGVTPLEYRRSHT